MDNVQELGKVYAEDGAIRADRYCATQHLIGSVCMNCGRVYRLVDSMNHSGGLSHGWCSEGCAAAGVRQARATSGEYAR